MEKYIYIATVGTKYRISPFSEPVELRRDHLEVLQGKVYYVDPRHLRIETGISYNVGQKVSIGGYPMGVRLFYLDELSITDKPVLEKAEIIEKEITNDNSKLHVL